MYQDLRTARSGAAEVFDFVEYTSGDDADGDGDSSDGDEAFASVEGNKVMLESLL